MKKNLLLAVAILSIGLLLISISGCKNPFGPDSLEPNAEGVYVFYPNDLPQIVFTYNPQTWLMTVENRASLPAKIRIRNEKNSSRGVTFTLRGHKAYSYTEYYGSEINITIWRDGITYSLRVALD